MGPEIRLLEPQYDQVGPGTRESLSETLDPGPQKFQLGPGIRDL